ncbi:MAG TPA: hypothetical protein VFH17_08340 [Coriobacteriia bacterium]|nr:hypothetical protein [Coriobacteriia bacterium]
MVRRFFCRAGDCAWAVLIMALLALAWVASRVSRKFREDWESWT